LTGWGQEQDKQAARAAGFDAHLTKPVDPATVEQVLADLLAAGAPRNDARPPGSLHSA
jgi:CheY-like chemotaxis protein